MLEDLAYQYYITSESNPRTISWGIVVAGAIVAALVNRSASELRRAPYFALQWLLLLLTAIVSSGSIAFLVQAIAGGFVWMVVAVEVLATAVSGFFFGHIAMARSRDAYGHSRAAVLAFIPLANLWLMVTPSKNEISANRVPTIPLLSGGLGILSGFVMLAGGIFLETYIEVVASRAIEKASEEGVFNKRFLVRTLEKSAKEVATPMTVDEVTTLLRVEADGRTLRYVYEISSDPEILAVSMRTELVNQICTFQALRPVIEAGATIEYLYLRRDLSEVGTVTITREICGY